MHYSLLILSCHMKSNRMDLVADGDSLRKTIWNPHATPCDSMRLSVTPTVYEGWSFCVRHEARCQACFPNEIMDSLRERFQDAARCCENRWCQERCLSMFVLPISYRSYVKQIESLKFGSNLIIKTKRGISSVHQWGNLFRFVSVGTESFNSCVRLVRWTMTDYDTCDSCNKKAREAIQNLHRQEPTPIQKQIWTLRCEITGSGWWLEHDFYFSIYWE